MNQNDNIQLIIYDIKGQKIKTLISEFLLSGSHITRWDGKDRYGLDVPSGIYIYQLISSNKSISNKMILLR